GPGHPSGRSRALGPRVPAGHRGERPPGRARRPAGRRRGLRRRDGPDRGRNGGPVRLLVAAAGRPGRRHRGRGLRHAGRGRAAEHRRLVPRLRRRAVHRDRPPAPGGAARRLGRARHRAVGGGARRRRGVRPRDRAAGGRGGHPRRDLRRRRGPPVGRRCAPGGGGRVTAPAAGVVTGRPAGSGSSAPRPEAPRRVLMTVDPVGGVFTYAVELARALDGHGLHVAMATMGGRLRREQRHALARMPNVSVHESTFRLEWMDDPWADVARAGEWLLGLEARVAPDVMHLNGYVHAALPWRAPVVVAAHSCVLSWWRAVRHEPAPAGWLRYRDAVAAGLREAAVVVAPTAAVVRDLERHYGPLPHARVVPNGRDARAVPVGSKRPLILCAARLWDEAKNVAALREVARRVPWPICVAGPAEGPGGARVTL